MKDLIQDAVFELFPEFLRGVVIARELRISNQSNHIASFLKESTSQRRDRGQLVLKAPGILAWDEAYQKLGSNPKKYPPSIHSLVQRALTGKPLPYINDAVALFNAVSLRYLLPCGGDDLDFIIGDPVLGLATGQEQFVPLGGTNPERPQPNEVIYFDSGDLKVMCRRWNWRNGDQTKITTNTRNLLINVDGLGDVFRPAVEAATKEIAEWLRTECNGSVKCDLMHSEKRTVDL
jgi:DNA/RNA-binding domain of Phe-tRNA-synthetase-like protein